MQGKQQDEKLARAETVTCLVALSKAFARTPGHKALTHWSRFEAALRRSLSGIGTIGQWEEKIRRELQISTVPSYLCSAFEALEQSLEHAGFDVFQWAYLVRKENAWFVLQLRLESQKRADAREEKLTS